MKKIASFTINHDSLTRGMYVSRVDGDVVTYDFVQQCSQRWWQDAELKRAMGDQTQKARQAPLQR